MSMSDRQRTERICTQLVDDYLAAFHKANPGQDPPRVEYVGLGYFQIRGMPKKCRAAKIQAMTATLRARVPD